MIKIFFVFFLLSSAAHNPAFADGAAFLPTSAEAVTPVSLAFNVGKKIVVVHHPSCGFSQRAFASFPGWFIARLKKDGLLLVKEWNHSETQTVYQWNLNSPALLTHIVRSEKSWSPIFFEATPNVFFLREGALVCQVIGWPPEGRAAELQKCLETWN